MRIGIVGGAECVETEYRRIVKETAHQLEFHNGHMTSGGARALATMMSRCDLVVIVTDVNSHAAVSKARQLARAAGRAPVYARRFGVRGLTSLIDEAMQARLAACDD
jgi:predicted component of type VI protein secretion system